MSPWSGHLIPLSYRVKKTIAVSLSKLSPKGGIYSPKFLKMILSIFSPSLCLSPSPFPSLFPSLLFSLPPPSLPQVFGAFTLWQALRWFLVLQQEWRHLGTLTELTV